MSEEKNKLSPVTKGAVTTKQRGELSKLVDTILPGAAGDVKSHVIFEVLIPAAKRAALDALAMLLGEKTRRGSTNSIVDRVSYIDYSSIGSSSNTPISRGSSVFDLGNLVFEEYNDADIVLSALYDQLSRYRIVSVANLYELIGKQCPHTAGKYGWTKLDTAKIKKTSDGWMLCLPRAMPLD